MLLPASQALAKVRRECREAFYLNTCSLLRERLKGNFLGVVNGDGKADIIGFGGIGVWVGLSNGAGFDPVSMLTGDFTYVD